MSGRQVTLTVSDAEASVLLRALARDTAHWRMRARDAAACEAPRVAETAAALSEQSAALGRHVRAARL